MFADSVNIVDAREDFRLSLRKQKIDQFIFNKKERILEKKKKEKSNLEINYETLNLPAEIINYEINDIVIIFQFFHIYFFSEKYFSSYRIILY